MSHISNRSLVIVTAIFVSCGTSASHSRDDLLKQLRVAIDEPIDSTEKSARHSHLAEKVLDANALDGLSRAEVRNAIGAGDPCSRHPRCAELDFDSNDWFYHIGIISEPKTLVQSPILIVGFDHTGRVSRTWILRTH